MKTDGQVIWALEGGRLNAVDARSAAPRLLSSLDLASHSPESLLRFGDKLLVLGSGARGAHLTQVDVSDPAQPVVVRTEMLEGYVVDARLTGRTARIVVSSTPDAPLRAGSPARARLRLGPAAPRRQRPHAQRHQAAPELPHGAPARRVLRQRGGHRLHGRSRPRAADDRRRRDPRERGDGLRVGARASTSPRAAGTPRTPRPRSTASTRPIRTGPRYSATGAVPGELLSQFALSEEQGVLRAASTAGFDDDAESLVTTLADRDGRLVQLGQVGGLGRGRADLRGPLPRRRRLRRHLPPGRPALHRRPRRSRAPASCAAS